MPKPCHMRGEGNVFLHRLDGDIGGIGLKAHATARGKLTHTHHTRGDQLSRCLRHTGITPLTFLKFYAVDLKGFLLDIKPHKIGLGNIGFYNKISINIFNSHDKTPFGNVLQSYFNTPAFKSKYKINKK